VSGRFFLLLVILAVLVTAVTYFNTTETQKTLSERGMADLDRRITLHGWPWGYYAQVVEMTQMEERRVAVIEYTEVRLEELGQTYLVWFVFWLIVAPTFVVVTGSRRRRD